MIGAWKLFLERISKRNPIILQAQMPNELAIYNWPLDNPTIKAIWCARGGYGTLRIIDALILKSFKNHPKWIVGYSDVTVLHNALNNLGYESLACHDVYQPHGRSRRHKTSVETLKAALFGSLKIMKSRAILTIDQETQRELVGGNLSLLTADLGSRHNLIPKETCFYRRDWRI